MGSLGYLHPAEVLGAFRNREQALKEKLTLARSWCFEDWHHRYHSVVPLAWFSREPMAHVFQCLVVLFWEVVEHFRVETSLTELNHWRVGFELCGTLNDENVSHKLVYLNPRSSVGAAVWRCGFVGNMSLEAGFVHVIGS